MNFNSQDNPLPCEIAQINPCRHPNFAVRMALVKELPTIIAVLRRRTATVKSDKMA